MQAAKLVWHGTHDAGVAEDKGREEREITKLWCDAALERHVTELQAGDTLTAVTRDASPRAEGRSGRPVAGKDAKGVLELCFEGEQRSKVCCIRCCGERGGACCAQQEEEQRMDEEGHFRWRA